MLPAGFRQRDQTKKSPTGPYDREALQQHLEKLALEHPDREDLVPFNGEKKGVASVILSEEPNNQIICWCPLIFMKYREKVFLVILNFMKYFQDKLLSSFL